MSRKSVLVGMSWSLAEKALPQILSLVISVILARLLGPTEYRAVAVVLVFINVCDVLVTSGFGLALIQKVNADKLDYSTMSIFSIGLGVIIAVILCVVSPEIERYFEIPFLSMYLSVMSLRIPIAALNSIQRAYLQKKLEFNKIFLATLMSTFLSGLTGITMSLVGFGTWALIAQYMSSSIISTVIFCFVARYPFGLKFSWIRFAPMFHFSWKLTLSALISKMYDECRAFVIDKNYSGNSISFYNKGLQIPNVVVSTVNASTTTVMFPVMAEAQRDLSKLQTLVKQSIRFSTYIITPMMLGLMIISEPLVSLLFSQVWSETVPYMQIFAVSYVFVPIIELNQRAVQAIGKSGIVMSVELVNKGIGIISIIMVILLCDSPIYIAVSFLFYMLFALISSLIIYGKIINYSIWQQLNTIKGSTLLSLIMCSAIWPLRYVIDNELLLIICQVGLGVCIYIILSIVFNMQEVSMVYNLIKKIVQKRT